MTNKSKTLAIRLNPEKILDKKILDFLDNPYISKSKLVKTAIIHEIINISTHPKGKSYIGSASEKEEEDIYKDILSDNPNMQAPTSKNKERLDSGFKAFSDKDF
ncbi:dihydrodipicolinate reductase (plasmid) [Lactobacillus sp. ESL0731]|uniref:dihydrodipicolinate reductase n=1 Tax=unclassified Lactobacillus TaxID=2620435 RepID=UPI0023F8E0F3|nr:MULTISPECIES: dihydrodipicolinate reductase [unclassified Lactobacillus]WEV52070.1 dihydrodipicolinate reductase [Lactobacillus sp. ESL0700]WEV63239.1 dihydrodipicolinate reductase [Lactobacillus sp. ESL0731]